MLCHCHVSDIISRHRLHTGLFAWGDAFGNSVTKDRRIQRYLGQKSLTLPRTEEFNVTKDRRV